MNLSRLWTPEVHTQVYGLIEDHTNKLMKINGKIEIFDSQSSPNHKSEYERFAFILFLIYKNA